MSDAITLKVYNHSPKCMEFEVTNDRCMYIPAQKRITVPAYSWGVFDTLATCNAFFEGCYFGKSRFTISAYHDSKKLGTTTYRAYISGKSIFFGTPFANNNISFFEELSKGPSQTGFVFDRQESYGDLFFNGRGIYMDNSLKDSNTITSMAVSYGHPDKAPPTSLVNSNRQFAQEVDDSSLGSIAGNWINVGLAGMDAYSFFSGMKYKFPALDNAAIKALEDSRSRDAAFKYLKEIGTSYFNTYKDSIGTSDEITVHLFELQKDNMSRDAVRPTPFHVVFTDTTANAPDIMLGNFYLPPPPGNDNTFYQNILHLSQDPTKLRQGAA